MNYPAYNIPDDVHNMFPTKADLPKEGETYKQMGQELGRCYAEDVYDLDVYSYLSGFQKDVLIIHGIRDQVVPIEGSIRAMQESYSETASQLIFIAGKKSFHGYSAGKRYIP